MREDEARADRELAETGQADGADGTANVPDWEDEYLDRVSDRLMFNYDLEKDREVAGRTFPLYGKMLIKNQKQFFIAALRYGYHESTEHLFVDRRDEVTTADLEELVALGHELSDDWITLDDHHFETQFTFVCVVPEIADEVASFVSGFRDRTLLKHGFKGHYEVNLVVVAPERERVVASEKADVWRAFQLWDSVEAGRTGLVDRVRGLFG
ncbi:hypothetical protein [Haloarchaeobius sp. TZWWS8]|uniref:hypothetical protein n=1 Tax=Haloarchaeobius sp. TZWWS8 TaxID=3446121 RepID=UPI003EBC4AEA